MLAGVVGSADAWAGDVILREAYRRLGIALEIRKLPAERALRMASDGQLDGEVQRIDAVKRTHPNLVQCLTRNELRFFKVLPICG